MVDCHDFVEALGSSGINFFTGVPDSQKSFGSYIEGNIPASRHIIAANEGNALAIAAGYFLATGNVAAVYLQNSGLGNLVNPLASLNHPTVYGLPALLIIGWRGEPGVSDEPQHLKQGEITPDLLGTMDIPIQILDSECDDLTKFVAKSCEQMQKTGGPLQYWSRRTRFRNTVYLHPAVKKNIQLGEKRQFRKFCHVFLEKPVGSDDWNAWT